MLKRHEKFDVDYAVQLFMKAAKVNINASYYNESYDKIESCYIDSDLILVVVLSNYLEQMLRIL